MSFLDKFKKKIAPPERKEKEVKSKEQVGAPKSVPVKARKPIRKETGEAYRILIRPLVTERATHLAASGKYAFIVSRGANKIEIKKAVENVYGVEPVKVNIINMSGKWASYGRQAGRTKNWKKAIVTLKPGEKIEVYEGV